MRHIDLFTGIAGFALAARYVWDREYEPVVFCDSNAWCQKLIQKRFPGKPVVNDVRKIQGHEYGAIDILTGGFPCQPFSVAGQKRGDQDDRYLWPEMFRIIRTGMPRWVVAENVYGLIAQQDGVVFEQVCADLESAGYDVGAFVIPACAVDAPHRRDRVWIVGHTRSGGLYGIERGGGQGRSLRTDVLLWPTPKGSPLGPDYARLNRPNSGSDGLSTAVAREFLPTPTVQDSKNNGSSSQQDRNTKPLNALAGGPLNPVWVEWLMGYPEGWTDLGG